MARLQIALYAIGAIALVYGAVRVWRLVNPSELAPAGLAYIVRVSECRNHVSHDQVEVWATLAESHTHGTDQRSTLQGAYHNLCVVIQSVHELGIEAEFQSAV